MKAKNPAAGYSFGTFKGVFTPSILTIIGVVMYLRFGWTLGNLGLAKTLLMVTVCSCVTLATGLSLSALATNRAVRGGGAYFLVSRAFGAEAGAAIGIPLFFSQAVSTAFYVAGFSEAFISAVPAAASADPRVVGSMTLVALALLSVFSASLALKTQFFIMGAIVLSLVSFFLGSAPAGLPDAAEIEIGPHKGFFTVLAVFFPAVTGILSGLGMSGDLRDGARSIPRGTIAAVLTGYAIYMAVPLAFTAFVGDHPALVSDPALFIKCSRWPALVLLGVWAACLSSALGSMLAAPRVLQALARDRLAPAALGRGFGSGDNPIASSCLTFAIALAAVWAGGVDALAPVLTMVNLLVYALLNLAAALEENIGSAAWRPTFKVPARISWAGLALCLAMMLLIGVGPALAAIAAVGAIHALMVRRRLNARWDDIRRSVMRSAARFVLRRLEERPEDGRNWQPDILALGAGNTRRLWLADLASAISRDRGFLTFASVVPEEGWDEKRIAEAHSAVRDWALKRDVEAFARVYPARTPHDGMLELVKAYGFGPLSPNTILAGAPSDADSAAAVGDVAALAARRGKNILLASGGDGSGDAKSAPAERSATAARGETRRIDLWWRGGGGNAPFLLALASLIRQSDAWRDARLRLCHVAEGGEAPENAEKRLEDFLRSVRVNAEVYVVVPDGNSTPQETICAGSGDADLVLLGLRPPASGESGESYGAYLLDCRVFASDLRLVLFALASENVDFGSVFQSFA